MNILKYIILLFLINFNLYSFDSIEILNPNITISKSGYFKTNKDLTPQEAFEYINSNEIINFPQKAYSTGITNDTYWFAFEISTKTNENLYLESKTIFSDNSYDLFVFEGINLTKSYINGSDIPIELREVKTQQIRFPLISNSNDILYLIKCKSQHPIIPMFSLGNMAELDKTWINLHNIMLISYFIGLSFILYNFILYLITKDKSFIYYCIYISGLLIICLFGRSYIAIDINLSPMVMHNLLFFGLLLIPLGGGLFTINFLDLKTNHIKLTNKIILFSTLTTILIPLYFYTNILFLKKIYLASLVILSIFIFYAGFITNKKNSKIGLYFMFSTCIGLAFLLVLILLFIPNLVQINIWYLTLSNQALIWNVITLSLTLAYRIKLLQEEKETNQKLAIVKSKQSSLGEISGNLAHQWRQPLAELGSINTNIEAKLRFSEISKEELLDKLEINKNILNHLSQTINTFQSFFQKSNIETKFSVNDEIKRCIDFINDSMKNNQISINFSSDDNYFLQGNANEFSQIILNIVLNSKDALCEKNTENKYINIALKKYEDKFKIEISDNAGGIKIEPIESIFESYVTTKDKGIGIGLFIVKTIVEQKFKGKISVFNTQDGARFEIVF